MCASPPWCRLTRSTHIRGPVRRPPCAPQVQLDGAVYTKVEDSYKASYGIEDPESAIIVLAQSAMRKEVGNLELDQVGEGHSNGGLPATNTRAATPTGCSRARARLSVTALPRAREAQQRHR